MDKIDLRYQRGKIYTVRCYDDDNLIYVGSTIQPLSVRMSGHKNGKTCSLYKYINNNFNGNWKNWYIELYEEYPCNNKELLEKKEGEITRLIGSINKRIEGRTKKEWYEDNKEILVERYKKYRDDNKDKKAETNKKYREANKQKILENQKIYYENNKEILNQKKREYSSKKVICDNCRSEVRKDGLKRHQKSKKCLNFVK